MLSSVKRGVFVVDGEGIEDIDKAISELDKKMEGLNIARICFHEGDKSLLMSMLIRIKNKYHYPIHRHIWKDESYTILEGSCDFIEYDENGKELKNKTRQRRILF